MDRTLIVAIKYKGCNPRACWRLVWCKPGWPTLSHPYPHPHLNSLTAIKGSGRNKKLPPRRILQ
jgi:hypothetical protein